MFQLAHGAAVRVLEHPEHAFHAGADAVADGFVSSMSSSHIPMNFFISSLSSPMSSSMPGMRYAWIVFQCLPSLYGGISGRLGRSSCAFMPIV